MTDFHQAAREEYLDQLQGANRKELNTPDEDGLTPTLLAAAYGNLAGLRLIVGRGGDPDKCDYMGNSALHWAVQNGHINCVSFLVNFGVNLWALDNSLHTAKEIAGIKGHNAILTFLDKETARRGDQNKKYVEKLKAKAIKDADKRIKKYKKMQEEMRKKESKLLNKTQKQAKKLRVAEPSHNGNDRNDQPRPSIITTPIHKDSIFLQPSYSELVHPSNGTAKTHITGVQKILRKVQPTYPNSDFKIRETDSEGNSTVRSIINGVRRDSEVLLVPKNDNQNGDKKKHIGDVFTETGGKIYEPTTTNGDDNDQVMVHEPPSMFDRAGFGNYTFRRSSLSSTLQSIPNGELNGYHDDDNDSVKANNLHNGTSNDSIGSAGSLVRRSRRPNRWSSYNDDDDYHDDSALEMFLTANDLRNCLLLLRRERIDLQALLLLKERDLEELGLAMGYRKKLMEAINHRKEALVDAREVYDSKL